MLHGSESDLRGFSCGRYSPEAEVVGLALRRAREQDDVPPRPIFQAHSFSLGVTSYQVYASRPVLLVLDPP